MTQDKRTVAERRTYFAELIGTTVGALHDMVLKHIHILSQQEQQIVRMYLGIGCKAQSLEAIGKDARVNAFPNQVQSLRDFAAKKIREQILIESAPKNPRDQTIEQFFTRERAAACGVSTQTLATILEYFFRYIQYTKPEFNANRKSVPLRVALPILRKTNLMREPGLSAKNIDALKNMLASAGITLFE